MFIGDLDKAEVLAALYNAAKPQGMGFLQYDPEPWAPVDAAIALEEVTSCYFDYVKGRVMKIDLSGDEVNTWGYNRDNGDGVAEQVVDALRKSGSVHSGEIAAIHEHAVADGAAYTRELLGTKTTRSGNTFTLGFSDVAGPLSSAIDKATLVPVGQ